MQGRVEIALPPGTTRRGVPRRGDRAGVVGGAEGGVASDPSQDEPYPDDGFPSFMG